MIRVAHLSSGFMLTSMLGFLLSVVYVPEYSTTWSATFAIFFILMFVASIISMTYTPVRDPLEEHHLAVHEQVQRNPPGHHRTRPSP